MHKQVRKRFCWLFSAFFIMLVGGLFVEAKNTLAIAGSDEDLLKIALLDGVRICYQKGDKYVKSNGIQVESFNNYGLSSIFGSKGDNDGTVIVPTMVGNTLSDSDVSCEQVFNGYSGLGGKIKGLNAIYGKGSSLSFYGYVPDSGKNSELIGDGSSEQIKITLGVKDNGTNTAATTSTGELICDGEYKYHNGWISKYHYWEIKKCSGDIKLQYSKNTFTYFEINGGSPVVTYVLAGEYEVYDGVGNVRYPVVLGWAAENFNAQNTIKVDDGVDFKTAFASSNIYKYIKDDVTNAFSNIYPDPVVTITTSTVSSETITSGENVNSYYKFALGWNEAAAGVAVKNIVKGDTSRYIITGSSSNGEGSVDTARAGWTTPYVFSLYYKYLVNIVSNDRYKDHISFSNCGADVPSTTYYFKNSPTTWCAISMDTQGEASLSESLAVVKPVSLVKGTFADVLEWLKTESNYRDFRDEDYLNADIEDIENGEIGVVDPDGENNITTEINCMSSGAAQTLGWIVCPVLDFMKNASESLYNGFVEPALTVEPQLFTRNSTSGGAWSGWETFRNIANILLSILILVVIFSQLTGYGIDNYGIKKILPKIIVAAVLMNLSYWICIALVDVSNIFGNSLQAFFDGLAGKVTLTDAAKWGLGDAASSAAATVFLPAALLTALAGMIFAVAMEGGLVGLLLALFVGAIAVVISILFLFILLAAREAAIVILTVLSPLALACFMLPNTKRLFDKWWKLFYSLLLVYPICGVLVGGGNYVSKLLLAAGAGEDGFFSAFMAMIIGVVPIFFIPTVLKGSLNMMGQLGAKISGFGTKMGNRISGDANRAVKGSERYKNYQDDRARMRKINAANRDINNLRGRDNLNDRQKRRLAQSMAIVANERENEASRHNMIHGGYDARLAGAEAKADAQRVADIESMLSTGRMNVDGQAVEADSGEGVNSNSPASLAAFHKAALARHASATTAEERSNAMAQIRAVQNMMSKTDAGRAAVMGNLADAVTRAQNANDYSTSKMAASHLMSDFGDLYKTKNRGAHSMIKDLSNDAQMGDVQASIRNGTYDAYGVDKYTEETLAGADDAALDKLIAAMNPIVDADGNTVRGASLTGESLETLQNTAYQALEKSKAGTLNIKPEVAAKLEQIRNGYVPQGVTQAQQQSQSAQQQAQNIQDSILQELQNINTELHNQNRGDNGGQPKPPTILGPDGKPLT